MYANIIIDISHEKLDRTFQYIIPEHLESQVWAGVEVNIPFGKGNRIIKGYIIEVTEKCEYDVSKMKEIVSVSSKSEHIEGKLIALAGWIKENYGSTMIQALKTVIPVKKKVKAKEKKTIRLLLEDNAAKAVLAEYVRKHYTAKSRLLAELIENKVIDYEVVTSKLNITSAVIKNMESQSVIAVDSSLVYRNPMSNLKVNERKVILNKEQQYVVDEVTKDYLQGIRKTYLLHGITGSGKTEVYINLIRMVIEQGKQAIVLIPEISLTYQTVMRFVSQFGDRVSIINSKMSQGERYDQFERAKKGMIDVMIGPRSALFTPFNNLGFIIIDEEHEGTYKSENIPKYHARETAVERARIENASVMLGSATPSIDAYYKAVKGEYRLFTINSRFSKSQLPIVHIADLREELKNGNKTILSRKLRELIQDRLEKKEQIMLFINRRGYAGFVSCRSCGYVVKCPHCDVSLSSHNNGKLICHYCGYETSMVNKCPKCSSKYIGGFRAGTQQIEEVVKKEYPTARVLRMDMDTTKSKDGHEKILSAFANGEADVLVGTQMIVKGHDFPNVTLVGVLAADMSLYSNDYHAPERTFQLLTQAAGRAGRASKPGEVVIQTYNPEHYSIECAANQNFIDFYEKETAYRGLMGYPPMSNMMVILLQCVDEAILEIATEKIKKQIDINKEEKTFVIGPSNCTITKLKDVYRKVIYIKNDEYNSLVKLKDILENHIKDNNNYKNVSISFDFNPMNTY